MPKFSSGAAKVRRLFPAGGEIKKLVQVYGFLNFWVPGVGVAAFTVSSMWRKCIFLVIKYICFEDLLDYVHFVAKPLFYRHFAGVQQESLFQVFVNQVLLCVFSAGYLLEGRFSHDEVRMCGSCRSR